jgi:hypothetical protein
MTIDVEIMLRGGDRVYTDTVRHDRPAAEWTPEDAEAVLVKVLEAVDRVQHPAGGARPVSLRGLSWIVSPYQSGVVIALEIHSASIVAGPFALDERHLDGLIRRALDPGRVAGGSPTVH